MPNVIAITVGHMFFCPFCCGRCCATILVICGRWKSLKGVLTLDRWLTDVLANVTDGKPFQEMANVDY